MASTASQIGPRSNPRALVSRSDCGAKVAADDPVTPELGPAARRRAAPDLEAIRSAPKQIYDPSVERKKPQHGSSSSRKRARTPTPPVGGILPNAEGRPPKRSAAAAMERTVLNRA